ncbi:MAG TPA: type II toxin-antitoxin system RelE/ParE family toxin [Flavobacteriales bacterium]|nr:type II toxin-antitoxin system RelE/ParE family toxin [Flavobacteriales bacterium]
MSFEVRYTSHFSKAIKRLAKKYPSVRTDLSALLRDIQADPMVGTPIGRSCYKVRMPIRSKGKGKSGGARVITYVRIVNNLVVLLTVYDKSEKATLTDAERDHLIDLAERL